MITGDNRELKNVNREQYLGEKKKQLRDGFGVYVYENKFFRYEGEWKNGKKHGHGKLLMADGSYYEGQFENGEIRGYGFRVWADSGNKYAGQFHRGELHGRGVMEYKDGAVYEGDWCRNARQGRGTLTDKDGQVYEGEFYKHRKHGEGKMSYINGDEFEGHWVSDKRQGHGFLQRQDGTTYEGQWLNDVFSGHGVMRHCSGIVYEGQWLHGRPALEAAQLSISNGPTLQCCQGLPFEVVVEVRTSEDEVLTLESGRELRVSAAFRSRPPVPPDTPEQPTTPLLDVIEDAEEKTRPTPFGYDVVPFPLTDEVPAAGDSRLALTTENTVVEETAAGEAEDEAATAAVNEIVSENATEAAAEAADEGTGQPAADTAPAEPEIVEPGIQRAPTEDLEREETNVTGDAGPDEPPPVLPVPNIRTDEGCGMWETLILPQAPPLYRPYSLLDEEAGITASAARDTRARSRERRKGKERDKTEVISSPNREDAKAKYKRLGNENFARPGEYVIIVEDVSDPPFFDTRLQPAFLRVELQAPRRERRSTMKKPEEKKKQWNTPVAIAHAMARASVQLTERDLARFTATTIPKP